MYSRLLDQAPILGTTLIPDNKLDRSSPRLFREVQVFTITCAHKMTERYEKGSDPAEVKNWRVHFYCLAVSFGALALGE